MTLVPTVVDATPAGSLTDDSTALVEAVPDTAVAPTLTDVEPLMYWVLNGIWRANLDGSKRKLLFPVEHVYRIQVDRIGEKIYWIEDPPLLPGRASYESASTASIRRANLNGSGMETLIHGPYTKDFFPPDRHSLTLDVAGGKIYWTAGRDIWRANLDGSNAETVRSVDQAPYWIALDAVDRKLYWMEWIWYAGRNRESRPEFNLEFRRANLDGSNVETLIERPSQVGTAIRQIPELPIRWPGGTRLDVADGKMYWTEHIQSWEKAITESGEEIGYLDHDHTVMMRANLDGSNVETVTKSKNDRMHYIAFSAGSRKIYWLESSLRNEKGEYDYRILRTSLDGSNVEELWTEKGMGKWLEALTFDLLPSPKLSIESFRASEHSLVLGESFKLSGVVRSKKGVKSSPTRVWYYRSTDKDFTKATGVGKTDVPALAPDTKRDVSVALTAPSAPGVYYYTAYVGNIGEESITKNNGSLAVKITVVAKTEVLIPAAQRPPLYWINNQAGTLHRLIGAKAENLLRGVRNITSLAVDMAGGKLYWAEGINSRTGRIRVANLNGSNVKLVKDLTSVPLDIAVDTAGGKLYLVNAWGKVQRMNLDGSQLPTQSHCRLRGPAASDVRCCER